MSRVVLYAVEMIRTATIQDLAVLHDLAVRTFSDTFSGTAADEDIQRYLTQDLAVEQIAKELLGEEGQYWLAFSEDQPAAFMRLVWQQVPDCVTGPKPIELLRLYVDQPFLGRGIAQSLMETGLDWSKQQGFQTMFLGVWEHNYRAQKFYAKYGFEKVGEHVFPVGNDPQIDWYLARSI
jgi:diamine N-acetyltransferase